jgi:hypothetical protein
MKRATVVSQLGLPFDSPRRVRHGRPVAARPESAELHAAVLALRWGGSAVYRAGADHKVGDRLVNTTQLLALARAIRNEGAR